MRPTNFDLHFDLMRATGYGNNGEGNFDVVKESIETGEIDVNYDDSLYLRRAIRNGYFDIVKYLVKMGANIHADYGMPLRYAKYYKHHEIVEFLKLCIKSKKGDKMAKNLVKIMLKGV